MISGGVVGTGGISSYVELSTAIAVSIGLGPHYTAHYINAYSWHELKGVENMHASARMFSSELAAHVLFNSLRVYLYKSAWL